MEDFPSNSDSQKHPSNRREKKVEKVVQSEVVRRKKPLGKRFSETFVQGEAGSVWQYVAFDVLLPAAKDTIADAVSQGIERMLFGESRPSSRRGRGLGSQPTGTFTSYRGIASGRSQMPEDPRNLSRRQRSMFQLDQIEIGSRVEAEEVLDQMWAVLQQYEVVTVADFYEMCDITPQFTDEKYGWSNLNGAQIRRLRGGNYVLDLPRPAQID